jgi:tripartite-type tricarboxylate transporter receptor subunit TctC
MIIRALHTAFVLILAIVSLSLSQAHAQAPYPSQSIRFIVPYAPGGLPDTVARIVAQHLQERVGQSVVVENRAGGGAAAATTALMGAPADGYTFLVTDGGIVSTNPALFKQLAYNPKDIVPLALLGRTPMFLAAHPDLPVSTLRQFIEHVKARPGQINYGSSGVGSIHHLSMEALKSQAKLNMTHIPYRGTGQSVPALLGGHVQVIFAAYPSIAGAVDGKKIRLLAQNGEGRWFQAPDVPPVSDVVPNFDLATIVGLFARPGVPQPVIDKITAEVIAAANSPAADKQMRAAGIEPAGGNAAVLQKALQREIEKVAEVVKSANIQPQ